MRCIIRFFFSSFPDIQDTVVNSKFLIYDFIVIHYLIMLLIIIIIKHLIRIVHIFIHLHLHGDDTVIVLTYLSCLHKYLTYKFMLIHTFTCTLVVS